MAADDDAGVTDWRADRYDGLPLPHVRWGARVVDALRLCGDETVLDAGAGTGRDTALLLERLPRGRVIALDASPAMLHRLAGRFADEARVVPVQANLMRPLPVGDVSVDAVVSVASLHWLPDHDSVWHSFARVLRTGGVVRTECGGAGNIASVITATDGLVEPGALPRWTYAGVDETAERLAAAGFRDIEVRLRPDPAVLPDRETFLDYLATVVLRTFDEATVRQVAARLPQNTVDYVRLEVSAVRA